MKRLVIAIVLALAACVVPPPVSPPITPTFVSALPRPVWTSTIIPNALVNGGMNTPYSNPQYMTINLPWGWSFGWQQDPPCIPNSPGCPCPTNCIQPSGSCNHDYGCSWAMPEASRVLAIEYEGLRTREGDASAKVFVMGRQFMGWYYQRVEVGLGNPITFTTYLQAWMYFDYANTSHGQRSDKPTTMHLRVGIDPFGGNDVNSASIVWSPEGDAFRIDKNSPNIWKKFSVTTNSMGRFVTVFVYANPDWSKPALDFPELYDGNYARSQDLYVDESRLEVNVIHPIYRLYLPLVRR